MADLDLSVKPSSVIKAEKLAFKNVVKEQTPSPSGEEATSQPPTPNWMGSQRFRPERAEVDDPGEPITHPGGFNPFALDDPTEDYQSYLGPPGAVNWFSPLAKPIAAAVSPFDAYSETMLGLVSIYNNMAKGSDIGRLAAGVAPPQMKLMSQLIDTVGLDSSTVNETFTRILERDPSLSFGDVFERLVDEHRARPWWQQLIAGVITDPVIPGAPTAARAAARAAGRLVREVPTNFGVVNSTRAATRAQKVLDSVKDLEPQLLREENAVSRYERAVKRTENPAKRQELNNQVVEHTEQVQNLRQTIEQNKDLINQAKNTIEQHKQLLRAVEEHRAALSKVTKAERVLSFEGKLKVKRSDWNAAQGGLTRAREGQIKASNKLEEEIAGGRTVISHISSREARSAFEGTDVFGSPTAITRLGTKQLSNLTVDDINDILIEALGVRGTTDPVGQFSGRGAIRAADNLLGALIDEGNRRGLSSTIAGPDDVARALYQDLAARVKMSMPEPGIPSARPSSWAEPEAGFSIDEWMDRDIAEGTFSQLPRWLFGEADPTTAPTTYTRLEWEKSLDELGNVKKTDPRPPDWTAETATTASGQPPLPPRSDVVNTIDSWNYPKPGPFGAALGEIKKRMTDTYIRWQREVTDRFAFGNRAAGIARKEYKRTYGKELPVEMDFEIQAAFLGGMDAAGLATFSDAQYRAFRALGPDINHDVVEALLLNKHSIDILTQHPNRKMPNNGPQTIADAQKNLGDIAVSVRTPERLARVEAAAREYRNLAREILARDVAEGFVTPELAGHLIEMYPWYLPTAYADLLTNHVTNVGSRELSVTRSGLEYFSEVASGDDVIRPTASLLQHAIRASNRVQRNRAATAFLEDLKYDRAFLGKVVEVEVAKSVDISKTISIMKDGKRSVWLVPDEAAHMAMTVLDIPLQDIRGLLKIVRVAQSGFRHAFVTYNPIFMARQAMFDMITVASTRRIMPWEVAGAMYKNLKGTFNYDPTMSEMIRSGGDVTGWYGTEAKKIADNFAKAGRKNRVILYTPQTARKAMTRPWEMIRDLGHAVEYGPRRAVYERTKREALGRGVTEDAARQEAAYAFRRSTVDFQQMGQSMRLANHFYMFLNPAVQGTLLPFRALRDIKVARIGITGLLGMGLVNYAWNRQFEEYGDVPLYDKYRYMIWMYPSDEFDQYGKKVPNYFKIPMLRELGAFTAPIIYGLSKLEDHLRQGSVDGPTPGIPLAPESMGQFLSTLVRDLNPVGQVIEGGFVPLQITEVITEWKRNKDWLGRPIVPLDLVNIPDKTKQSDETTSELAIRVGEHLGQSPMLIDHMLKHGILDEVFELLGAGLREVDNHEDAYIVGEATKLREIQEVSNPEQAEGIHAARIKFLQGRNESEKEAIQAQERRLDRGIPFIQGLINAFHSKVGGNLRGSAITQAGKKFGISKEQSVEAAQLLKVSREKGQKAQEDSDIKLETNVINGFQWREQRRDIIKLHHTATLSLIAVMFPGSASSVKPQNFEAYHNHIATLGGTIKDRRTKSDLIYAQWRSVVLEDDPLTGEPDFNTYYDQKDKLRESLSVDDKKLLKDRRQGYMTSVEIEYDDDLEKMREYWEIEDKFVATLNEGLQERWNQYRAATRGQQSLIGRGMVSQIQSRISELKRRYRSDPKNAEVDAALFRWGFSGAPRGRALRKQAMEALAPATTPSVPPKIRWRDQSPEDQKKTAEDLRKSLSWTRR